MHKKELQSFCDKCTNGYMWKDYEYSATLCECDKNINKMKTRIVFCLKNTESISEELDLEYKDVGYSVIETKNDKYKVLDVTVNKIVSFNDEDQVSLDGWNTQFESLEYID